MKRTILFLVAAIAMGMGAMAQQQTATLQQGATSKVYYGEDSFKEAYTNALNGAKIILSAGVFKQVDSIDKSISIIGNGGFNLGTTTTFSWKYAENEGFEYVTKPKWSEWPLRTGEIPSSMIISANNVSVEGVYLDYPVILRNISGLRFSHCYINLLFCTGVHANTIIDQCYIVEDCSEKKGNSQNCCIKNSFVEGICVGNDGFSSDLTLLNSILYRAEYLNTDIWGLSWFYSTNMTIRNSIVGYFMYSSGTMGEGTWNGYYTQQLNGDLGNTSSYNNLWFLYPYHYNGSDFEIVDYLKSAVFQIEENDKGNSSAAYDAIFNEDVPWYDPNYIKTTVLGDDGTVVGPYGGTGFSLYPSVPRITESKIDTYTDGEGKLNVKVKVEVGQ